MVPDFTVMTADTAITLATLLTIVLFAYLVEATRVARAHADVEVKGGKATQLSTLLVIVAGMAWGLLYLLGVINNGGVEGIDAVVTWTVSGADFLIMIVAIVFHSLLR